MGLKPKVGVIGAGAGGIAMGIHKYHRYQPLEPSPQIQDLLDYLDSGADPIFWG